MANLLSKFRIDYSCLKMVQITDKPKEATLQFFNEILEHSSNIDPSNGKRTSTFYFYAALILCQHTTTVLCL